VDRADGHSEPDLRSGSLGGPQQDFMQLQAGQRAKGRDPLVTEKEFVLDDQPPVEVEEIHAVIAEPRSENLVENAERFIDAQRVRGLTQPDARNVKGRPPLDQHDLDALPRERGGSRQSANTAANDQNPPNVAHDRPSGVSRQMCI
jgi:hypothetical protein